MAETDEKRAYRTSGKVKMGGRELELYCSTADAAQLLGVSQQLVIKLCAVLGKQKRGGSLKVTAADLHAMVRITSTMSEFGCTARTAVKIAARIEELKKAQVAA